MLTFDLPQPPLSTWYGLIALGVPGIWLLARTMATHISDSPERRAVLLPGIVVTVWLLAIHLFGLLFRSFEVGLVLGTAIPSLAGLLLWRRRAGQRVGWPNIPLLTFAILAPMYLLPTMIRSDFHDKLLPVRHFAVVNNILNGTYPPRDETFAHTPLRYHYGVDTAAAVVTTITRVRFDVALDAVSFCGLAYAILAFGTLGGALFGPSGRFFAGFLGGFHGGFHWFYPSPTERNLSWRLMSLYHEAGGYWLISPSTSSLFQMPFSLGYPLFALTLLIAFELDGKARRLIGSLALLLTLATMSFSNITIFLTTGGALLGSLGLLMLCSLSGRPVGTRAIYFFYPLVAVTAAFTLAVYISGFYSIVFPEGPPLLLRQNGGIAGNPLNTLHWHLGSFGLLLPLALPGLIFSSRLRIFLLVHIVGCFYVFNAFRYRHTWDIAKFAFVAAIPMAILSSGTITWLWRRPLPSKCIALVFAAIISAPAITFHIPFWRNESTPFSNTLAIGGLGRTRIMQDELKAIEWLRAHAGDEEIVVRVMEAANLYTMLGGLPIIQPNPLTPQWGYSEEDIMRRYKLSESFSGDINEYKREGVRWIVIHTDPAVGDPYVPRVAQWVRNGECEMAIAFGDFQVYRIR